MIHLIANSYGLTLNVVEGELKRSPQWGKVDSLLALLEKVNSLDLQGGKCDPEIEECLNLCVTLNDKEGLKHLAYILFSGERFSKTCLRQSLLYLFHDYAKFPLCDLARVMKLNFVEWKKSFKQEETTSKVKRAAHEIFWNASQNYEPTKEISVSHGGGLRYLVSLLKEKKTGYNCDGYGEGIYVSPNSIGYRDAPYAIRTPPKHFDLPAILKAKIQAQYLISTINISEAVILKENLGKLENIEIQVILAKNDHLPWCSFDELSNSIEDQELAKNMIKSIENMKSRLMSQPY